MNNKLTIKLIIIIFQILIITESNINNLIIIFNKNKLIQTKYRITNIINHFNIKIILINTIIIFIKKDFNKRKIIIRDGKIKIKIIIFIIILISKINNAIKI